MYKDALKYSSTADKSVEELQVEVKLQRLNNHTLEEDQSDQEYRDDEDAGDQVTDQPPNLTDYQLVRDREPRIRTKPLRFRDEIAYEDSSKWKAVMKEEIDSLKKNKTCVQNPRYKARLVAREFTQRGDIDYNVVFSLIVRRTSIRVILALTACKDYELVQLDVKTEFLHGNLEEVIYMKQPPGYEQDDILIARKSKAEIGSTKSLLKKEFDIKELGEAKKTVGVEIVRDQSRKILRVSQSEYVYKILNNSRIDIEKSVKMPLCGHFKLSLKDYPKKQLRKNLFQRRNETRKYSNLCYCKVAHSQTRNSLKPLAQTDEGSSTPYIPGPVTADEKIQKKNDVKARSMLLMALPNEHLMTFNQYKYANSLFDAITPRFDRNDATKKTQKILLKQMYENFSAQSTESLDSIFNRLQKSEEKCWPKFKFWLSEHVIRINSKLSTASPQVSTANLSDAIVYAFLANQPNGSQLMHEDLKQIHEDDLEEMDLKWQLTLLSMRAKRFFQKTGKKITINGSDTAGYDKAKENRTRNQETTRRTVNMEDTSSKAMVIIDEAGFDWSYMADDEAPTNMTFMDFSNSEESKGDDEAESPPEIERKTVEPSVGKVEVDIHKENDKPARRLVKYTEIYITQRPRGNQRNWNNLKSHQLGNISYLTNFKEFDGGYVAFEGGAKGGKITGKGIIRTATKDETSRILKSFITEIENLVDKNVKIVRCDNGTYFKNRVMNEFCEQKDHVGKFDGKSDEGFFVGHSTNSKAFRVYNIRTRKVEENLHINFLENKPIITDDGPKWLFDIDALTRSMKYVPVIADGDNKDNDGPCKESEIDNQERPNADNSTKDVNTAGPSINTASSNINIASPTVNTVRQSDDFFGVDNDMRTLDGVEVDKSKISTIYPVPTTPNTRIHKDHSLDNVISDMQSSVQIRRMTIITDEQGFISAIYEEKTHEYLHTCLFAFFLSQEKPKRITNALKDPAWVEAMQEELLLLHLQKVWTLVDLPRGKRAIGTKWVFKNKKDERDIVIRNKAKLVAQGFTQEEGIDYDEVFAPVARIKAIRLFLAYAFFIIPCLSNGC
uniref:Reverse transcriptase Ty1/copia-type domain-containing protein n=1 Tax=Tanacetum cinerariifolium TaxID=118510 RepID=A0A6L2LU29_TANCI|nr:hypothetical protein [Tanacetum cinerariifolium]